MPHQIISGSTIPVCSFEHWLPLTPGGPDLLLAEGTAPAWQTRLGSRFLGLAQQGCTGRVGLDSLYRRAGRPSQRRRNLQKVQASFFGVGAPEAVLVVVVALIVFGPKGLAQAVKSLGSTFRTISPSIRELVTASSDLRTSFEEQIGLDEIRKEFRGDYSRPQKEQTGQNGQHFGTDFDVDIEAKRREAAQLAWGASTGASSPAAQGSEKEGAPAKSALSDMSLEALEAELARRKAAKAGSR
ncbi:hypothetical protein WJX73_003749 [Symbiochloris irregularis]|uniref:Uncharacterized protein n=1 Tax=Symbiochloris irregularis TaxID=706552 RepID=A0AAW1NUQ9_9CHLO